MIVFDEKSVQSSHKYFLTAARIDYNNLGGFTSVPQ